MGNGNSLQANTNEEISKNNFASFNISLLSSKSTPKKTLNLYDKLLNYAHKKVEPVLHYQTYHTNQQQQVKKQQNIGTDGLINTSKKTLVTDLDNDNYNKNYSSVNVFGTNKSCTPKGADMDYQFFPKKDKNDSSGQFDPTKKIMKNLGSPNMTSVCARNNKIVASDTSPTKKLFLNLRKGLLNNGENPTFSGFIKKKTVSGIASILNIDNNRPIGGLTTNKEPDGKLLASASHRNGNLITTAHKGSFINHETKKNSNSVKKKLNKSNSLSKDQYGGHKKFLSEFHTLKDSINKNAINFNVNISPQLHKITAPKRY